MPSVETLVRDPDTFFRERSESPSMWWPAGIVTLAVVFAVANAGITAREISAMLSDADVDPLIVMSTQIGALVASVFVPFLTWVLYAGLFHAISSFFDGEGSFTGTLALVGWGFFPVVVRNVLSLAVTLYRWEIRGVDRPDLPANLSLETQEGIQQFNDAIQEMTQGPLVVVPTVLALLFTLWSAYLWVLAVKHGRDVSTRQAAISVGVPALIGVLFTLRSLANAL